MWCMATCQPLWKVKVTVVLLTAHGLRGPRRVCKKLEHKFWNRVSRICGIFERGRHWRADFLSTHRRHRHVPFHHQFWHLKCLDSYSTGKAAAIQLLLNITLHFLTSCLFIHCTLRIFLRRKEGRHRMRVCWNAILKIMKSSQHSFMPLLSLVWNVWHFRQSITWNHDNPLVGWSVRPSYFRTAGVKIVFLVTAEVKRGKLPYILCILNARKCLWRL